MNENSSKKVSQKINKNSSHKNLNNKNNRR